VTMHYDDIQNVNDVDNQADGLCQQSKFTNNQLTPGGHETD